MILEEFALRALHHVTEKDNHAADALSRLEMEDKSTNTIEWGERLPPLAHANKMDQRFNLMFPSRKKRSRNQVADSCWPLTQ